MQLPITCPGSVTRRGVHGSATLPAEAAVLRVPPDRTVREWTTAAGPLRATAATFVDIGQGTARRPRSRRGALEPHPTATHSAPRLRPCGPPAPEGRPVPSGGVITRRRRLVASRYEPASVGFAVPGRSGGQPRPGQLAPAPHGGEFAAGVVDECDGGLAARGVGACEIESPRVHRHLGGVLEHRAGEQQRESQRRLVPRRYRSLATSPPVSRSGDHPVNFLPDTRSLEKSSDASARSNWSNPIGRSRFDVSAATTDIVRDTERAGRRETGVTRHGVAVLHGDLRELACQQLRATSFPSAGGMPAAVWCAN